MVIKKIFLFLCLISFYNLSMSQNSFYDDIHLMDYQRVKQLLNDSNGVIAN